MDLFKPLTKDIENFFAQKEKIAQELTCNQLVLLCEHLRLSRKMGANSISLKTWYNQANGLYSVESMVANNNEDGTSVVLADKDKDYNSSVLRCLSICADAGQWSVKFLTSLQEVAAKKSNTDLISNALEINPVTYHYVVCHGNLITIQNSDEAIEDIVTEVCRIFTISREMFEQMQQTYCIKEENNFLNNNIQTSQIVSDIKLKKI